ncbi:MAG TPA: helix-turn-helix domain-containing protein [Anaerolineae bacterium]|nr:helix-turn-helix domain-containing protein [Anaerolineae bacterium]
MGRRTYSNEQRAQVIAALLAGQSVREVAREYQIPRSTVGKWSATMDRPTIDEKDAKKQIGDLILEYLREVLITLVAQQEVFRDATWLRQQPASEAAVLHGVLTDKAIRLLEAMAPDGGEDDSHAANV